MKPGLVIALPQGLNVSGVTRWGVRAANGLVARGRPAGLILHPTPSGQSRLDLPIDERVAVCDLSDRAPIAACAGDLRAFVGPYLDTITRVAGGGVCAVSPNLHGDCYGVVAAITQVMPGIVRTIGWQHSDIAYDRRLLTHYEPMLHRFVGVSERIAGDLRTALPMRRGDVRDLAYGVEVPETFPRERAPGEPASGTPIRLLYTGRIEHEQKRIASLVHLHDALVARGIAFELTLIGDGPASPEIDAACARRPAMRRLPPAGPGEIRALLGAHDAFVLGSRYEGLSISMLEALAAGCVPIVAGVRSGAAQAIADGGNGVLVPATPEDSDEIAGAAIADGVERALSLGIGKLARAAWNTAIERFSLARHLDAVEALIDEACAEPGRAWPATRACAFSAAEGSGGSSGSVPNGASELLRALLDRLAGERVVLHGAGRHTIELASVLAESNAEIVGATDDDPARVGQRLLGWTIREPERAHETGATAVVLSSWMHQRAMLARARVFERQGLAVHAIYPDAALPA